MSEKEINKIMDKINKNLKIIDSLLMENGFYKYISKVVNIEDGVSQLYDNLEQLQQENQQLKQKLSILSVKPAIPTTEEKLKYRIEKVVEYIEHEWFKRNQLGIYDKSFQEWEMKKLLEILKGDNK